MKKGTWKDRKEEIEYMLAHGWTHQEIADHYGVTFKSIRSAIYHLGLSTKKVQKELGGGYSVEGKGNQMQLSSKKGFRVRTLEQLLQACQVDLDVWEVDHHIVNTWENYSVADGHQTLYQVKAWLIRKKPVAIQPTVDPVVIKVDQSDYDLTMTDDFILVISDPQIGFTKSLRTAKLTPFHDRRALQLAVDIAAINRPEYIALIGDFFDLADWSDKFLRTPSYRFTTQPALEEAAWWLGKLRAASPGSKIFMLEGNHEKRMADMIAKYNPECYEIRPVNSVEGWPVISIPYLLGLDELDIEWIPGWPGNRKVIDGVVFEHGVKYDKRSGGTVRKVLDDTVQSRVVGHSHKSELAWRRLPGTGEVIFGVSCGCSCHVDGRVPGSDEDKNWTQGLVLISRPNGTMVPHLVPVQDGQAYYFEEIYESIPEEEIVKILTIDTGERWNY